MEAAGDFLSLHSSHSTNAFFIPLYTRNLSLEILSTKDMDYIKKNSMRKVLHGETQSNGNHISFLLISNFDQLH